MYETVTPNLDLAKKIIWSFLIDVKKYPEHLQQYLDSTSKGCERNYLVAKCIEAIDNLKKWL